MIILDVEQGSEAWFEARLGIPTASSFDKILTSTFKPSSQANAYMGQLLAEYMTGKKADSFSGEWMERGHKLEPKARTMYEAMEGVKVDEVGVVYRDIAKDRSCSPDGLIGMAKGLEIKCPKLENHIGYTLDNELPAKYAAQVHGSMYITGLDSWDFMSYHPEFRPLLITVKRDEKIDKLIGSGIDIFCDKLTEEKEKIDASKLLF
jgi:hypothetical protein